MRDKGFHGVRALVVAGAAVIAGAAYAIARTRPHLVRTMSGLALVYSLRDASGFGRTFELRPEARRVLAIGGGGFAFPKLVAAEHPGVHVDVVEIDPDVIRAARRWFFLDEAVALARSGGGDLRVICDDGRAFLERGVGPYDAIVLDAFVGAEPVRSLATLEALRAARASLAPGGVLLANVVSCDGGADVSFLRSVVATANMVFSNVKMALATDDAHAAEDNYLVVASDAPIDLPDAISYDAEFLGPVLMDGCDK